MTIRVYPSLDDVDESPAGGRVVAIGVFDGVHLGHQRILNRAVEEASRLGARSAAVTFYPHPEAVLRPRSAPRELTSPARKAELLEALRVDELVVAKFDRDFACLSPEAFCRLVLSDRLGAKVVLVGENFRFGYQGLGTAGQLEEYGAAHGFRVSSVALVQDGGEPVSSTRIRRLLMEGRVDEAAGLLGRPHRIEGEVASGAGRGRTLQAPTANLAVTRDMALPRLGVYVTRSTINRQETLLSVTSVGTNPTFERDRKVRIETLMLDFSGELYGSHVAVDFLGRIRSQRAFRSRELLAERIKKDVAAAREFHRRMLS